MKDKREVYKAWRKANPERVIEYNRWYYINVTKPKRQAKSKEKKMLGQYMVEDKEHER